MKGICFIEPLFVKTVQGIKTQTRRIVVCPPNSYGGLQAHLKDGKIIRILALDENERSEKKDGSEWLIKPKYKVGDIIYLKEPYRFAPDVDFIIYKFEYPNGRYEYPGCDKDNTPVKWQNKLFMSASDARYFIKITDVRAERLQDISDEDCIKEGIQTFTKDEKVIKYGLDGWKWQDMPKTPKEAYAALIDKINGKHTWDSNPYVWVYDYLLTEKPKDL